MEGWKAVQMDPTKADLSWYCMKPICQQAYSASFAEAQVIWARNLPQPPQEPPQAFPPPLTPSEPEAAEEPIEGQEELDQFEHDQSSDQAASDQAPREPPPELLAFETTDPAEAGFKDEPFPYSRFQVEPETDPEPKPRAERYVPRPSTQSNARFIHHDGTGEPDE
jgi:hypothetical protein